jgi:two-component system CheB/CheR fusion protein
LALASHELRTPLAALQAALQLAQRALPQDDTVGRSRGLLEQSLIQARRIDMLVEQLVDATRIKQNQIVLDRQPVDLTAVVARAVETAKVVSRGQEIALESRDGITVIGDALRLEQVLLNLLTNAIMYAPDTARIDVRLKNQDEQAVIEVQDFGPGIPEDQLPLIFDRAVRVARSGSPRAGLGLGLFIAREIIGGHGGTIDAQSKAGAGTTFTIRLPRAATEIEDVPD